MTQLTMGKALTAGLHRAMTDDDRVIVMGEDIGRLGGVFRITDGLLGEFGPKRVIDTPLAESGIVGTAVGLAMRGFRPVVEIQFDGFVYPAFDQIVCQVAKLHYRTRGRVKMPLTIRIPWAGGVGAAEHHSESPEAYFVHTAGLRVVAVSNPQDAYTVLQQAIACDDPVVFFEPKRLYHSKGEVDLDADVADAAPMGLARVVRDGTDVTIVTYGSQVATAMDAAVAAEGTAREAAARVRDELAQARAEAAGLEVASAEEQLASAAAVAAAAAQAAALLDELHARRRELDAAAALAETERARVADDLAAARERLRGLESDIARLTAAVVEGRGGFDSVAARIAATAAERDRARAVVAAVAARDERLRVRDAATAEFETRLATSPFADAAAVRAALLDDAGIAQLDAEVADHAARLTATRARLLELELDAVGDEIDADALARSAETAAAADAARAEAIAAHTGADGVAARLDDLLRQVDAALVAVQESGEDAAAVIRLADTVAGRAPNTMKMDLETFVLAAELEEIVAAANVRLAEMSSGRYTLHHSDARAARGRASGLGIDVLDAHTGRLRSPQSLSGGETFLASLALALGLGEVVTSRAGGIRLDTLFVDEGFGSLDPETLELAMRTLDDLRAGGRTVGVISHVEAMKEQLPAQILVSSTHEGPSVIRQDAARPSAESAREAR